MDKRFLILLFLLTGCDCEGWFPNQKLRREIFQQCISTMQKQPEHNHEDNNGHVVEECADAAYRNSLEWGKCPR